MLTTILGWLTAYSILAYGMWLQLGLALFALVAMPFDKRKILGINPWIKPLKFDLSIMITFVTIAAILNGFERYAGARTAIAATISISLSAENVLISLQSLRGVRSHMNESTPFDSRIWLAMGVLLAFFVLGAVSVLALAFIGHPKWPAAVTWGVRLGLLVFLAGSAQGKPMVTHGGHTIGAPDGVHGLPFVNWSTAFGDLRVAHFFALHSLQTFPLLGLLISQTSLSEHLQIGGIVAGSIVYAAIIWLMYRQAMAGRPLLRA